jgi:hypothetical protein
MCMYCRSLFVPLHFFFWSLCCLFFFDFRITPLVSSNSSYTYADDSTASYCNYDINKVVNTLETLHCCLVLVTSRCFLFVSKIRRVSRLCKCQINYGDKKPRRGIQIGFIERKGLYVFIHFKSGSDMVYVGEMKHWRWYVVTHRFNRWYLWPIYIDILL